MTQDALTVLNDIPFSIPPYFALIARAVVTLEGVALIGNPDYSIIMEAYRKFICLYYVPTCVYHYVYVFL